MIAIGIILIVAAVFLTIAVLMQQGKSHNLSGTIAGAGETFFGKSKAATMNKKLSALTTIVAIVFVVLVLVAYLIQGGAGGNVTGDYSGTSADSKVESTVESGSASESETEAKTEESTKA